MRSSSLSATCRAYGSSNSSPRSSRRSAPPAIAARWAFRVRYIAALGGGPRWSLRGLSKRPIPYGARVNDAAGFVQPRGRSTGFDSVHARTLHKGRA